MVSIFYQRHGALLLWIAALSLPFLFAEAKALPSNNEIETWLPKHSEIRNTYDQFKSDFGNEELILIGINDAPDDLQLVEATCARIERIKGVRQCWSPTRMQQVMRELSVPEEEIQNRLKGLAISADGELYGLIVLLSEEGLADRMGVVHRIEQELKYCQLQGDDVNLAGAPIVVAELDRLGSQEKNERFFVITLFISLCLLYYTVRQWPITLMLLGLTVWAINLTLSVIKWTGGEMNFILSALPVMVMVFTLAIAIHFLNYYALALRENADKHPLDLAFAQAWKPCCLATLTTMIGLVSLSINDIGPVSQFGLAASIGCTAALLTGLFFTPAVLSVCPYRPRVEREESTRFHGFAHWILGHKRSVALTAFSVVVFTGCGLQWLDAKIDPLDFLPRQSKVLSDMEAIHRQLMNTDSIEAIVDFGNEEVPFVEKLQRVRRLEEKIAKHPAVEGTVSLAMFFPKEMPENPLATTRLLSRARAQSGQNDYTARGERLWRISARLDDSQGIALEKTFSDLQAMMVGEPIVFTGITPLLEQAQRQIFFGFWESFATAFLIISMVMIASLRSWKAGVIAMIPNLTPISIVFGTLGWIRFPVDIGMMMTASIALGIAVDGTFHFLVRYQENCRHAKDSATASREALLQTGAPILQASVITGVGMLALTLSSFSPTIRFGYLMSTLLLAALIGDLILLPVLLSLKSSSKKTVHSPPHYTRRSMRKLRELPSRVANYAYHLLF